MSFTISINTTIPSSRITKRGGDCLTSQSICLFKTELPLAPPVKIDILRISPFLQNRGDMCVCGGAWLRVRACVCFKQNW